MTPQQFWYTAESLKAIVPLFIGIGVVYIAWRQWITAHHKVKLDLFDRRFKVLNALRKFFTLINIDSRTNGGPLLFEDDVLMTDLLFPRPVTQYVNKAITLSESLVITRAAYAEADAINDEQAKANHLAMMNKYRDELATLQQSLISTFQPYLDFRDLS